jgi:hypothetical protein
MHKNTILNNAIGAVLTIPRKALWTTTIAVTAFSLEAGVSVVGDHFSLNVGTPIAQAGEGSFANDCTTMDLLTTEFAGLTDAGKGLPAASCQGNDDPDNLNIVQYASEVFQAGTPTSGVPSGGKTDGTGTDYHVVTYVWSALTGSLYTGKKFTATFSLPNGGQFDKTGLAIDDGDTDLTNCYTPIKLSGGTATIDLTASASCTLQDTSELYFAFKLKGITTDTLIDSKVKLSVAFKDTSSFPPNASRSVVVAELKPGLKTKIIPEDSGFIYTSSAAEDKEFITTALGTIDSYISPNEAQIGYVYFDTGTTEVWREDAKTAFIPGQLKDTATLTITNGQFSASPGGGSTGKVFLYAGSEIDADYVDPPVSDTRTWTLSAAQLKEMAEYPNPEGTGKVPIRIRLDGLTSVNQIDGEPLGKIEVKLGSLTPTPILNDTNCPTCSSNLLRIPSDGKTCWVHNVPAPEALDSTSIRITNDHPTLPAKIIGTLYHEDGTSDDFTSVTVIESLMPKETVRIGAEDLVKLGANVTWKESTSGGLERRVMKLVSTVPNVEVFNLLRGKGANQPSVNVSTGVRGVDCYP